MQHLGIRVVELSLYIRTVVGNRFKRLAVYEVFNAFVEYPDPGVCAVALYPVPNLRSDDLLLLASNSAIRAVNGAQVQRGVNVQALGLRGHFCP